MNYLLAYLAVGALALVVFVIDKHGRRRRGSSDWSQLSDLILRTHQPWPEAILQRLLLPVIAAAAITLAWPVVVAYAIYFYRCRSENVPRTISPEPDRFSVKHSDLIERLPIETVESSEIVHDPLQAVPPVPFGHLNRAWLDFRRQIQPDDDIWSFQAKWGKFERPTEVRRGYASMRHGAVASIFVAKVSPIPKPYQLNRQQAHI